MDASRRLKSLPVPARPRPAPDLMRPPLASVEVARGRWIARTLETPREIEAALRLRHDVFHVEHWGRTLPGGLDIDSIDDVCDHVGVFEGERLIGCYRLACSLVTSDFYASKRFDLSEILASPGAKLELGRACVASDRRFGPPLLLLWRAIYEYASAIGASVLFGSASVRTHSTPHLVDLACALEKRAVGPRRFAARPLAGCEPSDLALALESLSPEARCVAADRGAQAMTPLFEAYLRAGADACGLPALDSYMMSADFLMALPLVSLRERFQRLYLKTEI